MTETIYEVLKRQHDKARDSLEKLSSLSDEYVAIRRENETYAAIELISHNEAESRVFHRRLMDFEALRDKVEEHQNEHEDANRRLRALLSLDVAVGDWLEHVKEIKETIEQHVKDEEDNLFPLARRYIDDSEAENLAGQFEEEQSECKDALETKMPSEYIEQAAGRE